MNSIKRTQAISENQLHRIPLKRLQLKSIESAFIRWTSERKPRIERTGQSNEQVVFVGNLPSDTPSIREPILDPSSISEYEVEPVSGSDCIPAGHRSREVESFGNKPDQTRYFSEDSQELLY